MRSVCNFPPSLSGEIPSLVFEIVCIAKWDQDPLAPMQFEIYIVPACLSDRFEGFTLEGLVNYPVTIVVICLCLVIQSFFSCTYVSDYL